MMYQGLNQNQQSSYGQSQYAQPQYVQSQQWKPGLQAPPQYSPNAGQVSMIAMEPQKSWLATVLLCQFLGTLGVHRFYTGRIVSGIFQLLTFGGCGIWTLIDLIMIVTGDFKDRYNHPLDHPPVMAGSRSWVTATFLCMFLGCLGVHRFYTGRVVSGIFQLLTFGGFGIWVLIDLIMIYTDSFKDNMGLLLTRMARVEPNAYRYPPQVKG